MMRQQQDPSGDAKVPGSKSPEATTTTTRSGEQDEEARSSTNNEPPVVFDNSICDVQIRSYDDPHQNNSESLILLSPPPQTTTRSGERNEEASSTNNEPPVVFDNSICDVQIRSYDDPHQNSESLILLSPPPQTTKEQSKPGATPQYIKAGTGTARSSNHKEKPSDGGPDYKDQMRSRSVVTQSSNGNGSVENPAAMALPTFKDQARDRGSDLNAQVNEAEKSTEVEEGNGLSSTSSYSSIVHAHLVDETRDRNATTSNIFSAEALTGGIFLRRRALVIVGLGLLVVAAAVGGACAATGQCSANGRDGAMLCCCASAHDPGSLPGAFTGTQRQCRNTGDDCVHRQHPPELGSFALSSTDGRIGVTGRTCGPVVD